MYVKQAHLEDLQEALARTLEFEAYFKMSSDQETIAQPCYDRKGQKPEITKMPAPRKTTHEEFRSI